MQELSGGNLSFRIEFRTTGDDRGPAIRVFGIVDGAEHQVLRFDCFDSDPHYHYDPTGKNEMFHLDPLTMGEPLEFSLQQLSERTVPMLNHAGFSELAASVDVAELRDTIPRIRQAVEAARAMTQP